MKKLLYLLMGLFLHISTYIQCSESLLLPVIWYGTAAIEGLSWSSSSIQGTLHGAHKLTPHAEKNLNTLIDDLHITQPQHINQSYSLWNFFAGDIYANHNTLFISKDIAQKLENNATLDTQTNVNLITALLMINTSFDQKILAAFTIVPGLIWAISYGINYLKQKYNWDENNLLSKFGCLTTQQKMQIAGLFIAAVILYQKYAISVAAKVFIK